MNILFLRLKTDFKASLHEIHCFLGRDVTKISLAQSRTYDSSRLLARSFSNTSFQQGEKLITRKIIVKRLDQFNDVTSCCGSFNVSTLFSSYHQNSSENVCQLLNCETFSFLSSKLFSEQIKKNREWFDVEGAEFLMNHCRSQSFYFCLDFLKCSQPNKKIVKLSPYLGTILCAHRCCLYPRREMRTAMCFFSLTAN